MRLKNREETIMFQLTRLLRGATLFQLINCLLFEVSTHAPLTRRDHAATDAAYAARKVSTHAPLTRRDLTAFDRAVYLALFQLTRLLRGATQMS